MFKRSDGYYIKNINPYQKLIPHIMPYRHDSMNSTTVDIRYKPIEDFIAEQRAQGETFSYIDIIMAAFVRLYAKRPSLNRFVMRKKIYQHNDITVSFVVKKKLVDNSEDTTVKLHFTGKENIKEIRAAVNKIVEANTGEEVFNRVDKTATVLSNIGHGTLSFAIALFQWLDNRNILPASIIETSPFHNSIFLTFLKSIKGDAIYHHCYDFGTTGIFIAVGKEKEMAVSVNGEIMSDKILPLGIVVDERFCDGLYFVNSMRLLKTILLHPSTLLENYEPPVDPLANGVYDEKTKKKYKRLEKQNAKKLKAEMKNKK